MRIHYGLAAGALALGLAAVSAAPARAATVTDLISFDIFGSYGVSGASWNGSAEAKGSFDITFDPTHLYLTQGISGVISNLNYSVTDSRFGSTASLTLNAITSFAFDGAGTLTLYSNASLGKALVGTPNLTIGINGWAYGLGSGVWYSQTGFGDTLTISGGADSVTITPLSDTAAPLPSTWTMLIAGFAGLGFFAYRGTKKNSAAIAAA